MRDYFYAYAEALFKTLRGDEILLVNLSGETSSFVRFNENRVRQAGSVEQNVVTLALIHTSKQNIATLDLSSQLDQDLAKSRAAIETLRAQLEFLPDDPYLNFSTTQHNCETINTSHLPTDADAVNTIMNQAQGLDLVGIWASGVMYRGFANTFGQRNWHEQATFNFDWSIFHEKDKAVKCSYAGFRWEEQTLARKIERARRDLAKLKVPERALKPGRYRVYLAPNAVRELMDMMAWRGFGLKSHRVSRTPLIKMISEGRKLNPHFTLVENHAAGLTSPFTSQGFAKPAQVTLIEEGEFHTCLAAARSAKEYKVPVNSGSEHPSTLELATGDIAADSVLSQLDTGLYINNLWYCNFSDHDHCGITGMTRFACFWVEHGTIKASINVMRFDDSIYNIFGKNLLGLTREQELIHDAGTYDKRSPVSYRLPGALVDNFPLTL